MAMPVNMILVMYVILCILSYDFKKLTICLYNKIKKKKDCIFYRPKKCLKRRNPRWPPTNIKIKIFTNNFTTAYAGDINNMSILTFSGMSLFFHLFLEQNILKYKFMQI